MGRGDMHGDFVIIVFGPGMRPTVHGRYKSHDAATRDAERMQRALDLAAAEDPLNAAQVNCEVVTTWKSTNTVVTKLWRWTWWSRQEQIKAEKAAAKQGAVIA